MTDNSELSARALRRRFRGRESDASRLRMLKSATQSLSQTSQLKSLMANVLMQALRFLAADSGLVLLHENGGLIVQAAYGAVLPIGARISLGGAIGAVLRPPMQPSLREDLQSPLRVGRSPKIELELLLPMRFAGKAIGVLAILSETGRITPNEDDLQALEALATILACAASSLMPVRPRVLRREMADSHAKLTAREQQVFALLPRGLSNPEIAKQLGIAAGTAKIHVEHILHKLGLKDRTQAAIRAAEWGYRT